jgi:hypothetical protein
MLSTTRGNALILRRGHASALIGRPLGQFRFGGSRVGPADPQHVILRRSHRIKFNLMGAGGLRTYISLTRIGDQPSHWSCGSNA